MADKKSSKVPSGRASRFAKVAGLAGGLAGGMLAEGARKIRAGERPKTSDLLLTPANAKRVADQLANMRGAAMKLGQILSMDTGDLLPAEWTDVLARLRSEADAMPASQLEAQLEAALSDEWPELLYDFKYSPIAAASIGQVHRAIGPKGKPVALKIQYPGIARSINSDVDNIATVLRVSGILPEGVELQPLLDEVKVQLHEEANYLLEAEHMQRYRGKLADDDRFLVPEYYPELSSESVLCMSFMPGEAIETLIEQDQDERNRVVAALVELMFTELFDWRTVQSDPNFANFLYQVDTGTIVLLDFGATRRFKAAFMNNYKSLAKAAIAEDRGRLLKAAMKLGYLSEQANEDITELLLDMFMLAAQPMIHDEVYDFGASDIASGMQEIGWRLQEEVQDKQSGWHSPPVDAMYLHRKIAGTFMLATRMGAQINVHQAISEHL
ncbi:MAG: AarF/ABC1/UbiB kinase family protein [Pseudomonadota bacterium]